VVRLGRQATMIDSNDDLSSTRAVLDAMAVRSKVIMHNLANQNTPGFKCYRVRFEELLREAHTAGRAQGSVAPRVERDNSGPPGVNNVSTVQELAILEKVRLLQDVFSRRAGNYFKHLDKAIWGR